MTDPAVPDPAATAAPVDGTAAEQVETPDQTPDTPVKGGGTTRRRAPAGASKAATTRTRSATPRAASASGAASPDDGRTDGASADGTSAGGAPKRAAAARTKRATSTSSGEGPKRTTSRTTAAADRPKRTPAKTAAAQSASDTVRPRRGAKADAAAAAASPPPEDAATTLLPGDDRAASTQPDEETTELLPPAAHPVDDDTTEILHPAASPDGADATTVILPPAVPAAPDGAEATTEILHPAAPPQDEDDAPTEILHPAAPAAPDEDDALTEILHPASPTAPPPVDAAPAHVRGEVDEGPEAALDAAEPAGPEIVLQVRGLSKRFGTTLAVDRIDLDVQAGSFAGIVGPNGAGKTTLLSMITGLLRPDVGTVQVHGIDVWQDPERAKRTIGVLPDALRLFDRLTGAQLLHYSGVLRGLDATTVRHRSRDLVRAFGLEDATGRMVADYSAGMTKKIALAAAMIHSPRLLVLDEPFESVDPVSAANIIEILQNYVASGGTVVLSSHGMDLIQRVCDHVAIIVGGHVLAAGTTDEVRAGQSLEDRFVELAGGRKAAEGMEWLHSFSD